LSQPALFLRLFVIALLCGASAAPPGSDRFLYVVGCDATVSKLDTVLDKTIDSVDLATRTGEQRVIPEVATVVDGCLSYHAVYDRAASRFDTVVPLQADPKPNGTRDYRVLGFSVPDLRLDMQRPAGNSLPAPPHLEIERAGRVTVVRARDWAPRTELDLKGFAGRGGPLRNRILETSGPRDLLRLFNGRDDALTIAVADRDRRTLTILHDIPVTTARNVHLAPGGQAVLVEEVGSIGMPAGKTGRLVLFDVATGDAVSDVTEPAIKDLAFLAISPNGKAIYHRNDHYRLISLGRTFVPVAVSRPFSDGYPGLFFADR
jgi:hypothetical protein